MDMTYTFDTELLSAASPYAGTPTLLNASLSSTWASGFDVVVNALSAGDNGNVVGLLFNKLTITSDTSTLSAATFAGNIFNIAVGYHGSVMGLLKSDRSVTIFTANSATTAQTSIGASTNSVSFPTRLRKRWLGYI